MLLPNKLLVVCTMSSYDCVLYIENYSVNLVSSLTCVFNPRINIQPPPPLSLHQLELQHNNQQQIYNLCLAKHGLQNTMILKTLLKN